MPEVTNTGGSHPLPGPAPTAAQEQSQAPSARHLLLVEDDPGDAFLVQELLAGSEDRFTVTWVSTIGEVAGARQPTTACALVDLNLPDASGLDALRAVLETCPGVPVVVLTGIHDRELGLAAVAAGAQDYLPKDEVTSGLLDRAVRYAVERNRAERSARALAEAAVRREHDEQITRGLLPQLRVRDKSLAMVTRYLPGNAGEVLGGDFMDAVELEDGTVRMIIGDVAGHGPGEAAIGASLRITWRALTLAGLDSSAVTRRMQDQIINDVASDQLFVTALEMTLDADRKRLTVRSAGHPSPILLSPEGIVELDGERAPVLGVDINDVPPPVEFDLPRQWAVLGYTDGLIEGRTPQGPRWGTDGLMAYLEQLNKRNDFSLAGLPDVLINFASYLHGSPLPDDMAILLMSRTG